MLALGRHVLLELFECNDKKLNDVGFVKKRLEEAAKRACCTIVKSVFHEFNPFGLSGVVIIAESHFAIHTWPEYGYAAVDMFTCGKDMKPEVATVYLVEEFEAERNTILEISRGVFAQKPPTGGIK